MMQWKLPEKNNVLIHLQCLKCTRNLSHLPSEEYVQILQTNLLPPSINCTKGLMYARHLLHRTGPLAPWSTILKGAYRNANQLSSNTETLNFIIKKALSVQKRPTVQQLNTLRLT